MSEAGYCASSVASSVNSDSVLAAPPLGTVEVKDDSLELDEASAISSFNDVSEEGDEFLLGIVADRAEQARDDIENVDVPKIETCISVSSIASLATSVNDENDKETNVNKHVKPTEQLHKALLESKAEFLRDMEAKEAAKLAGDSKAQIEDTDKDREERAAAKSEQQGNSTAAGNASEDDMLVKGTARLVLDLQAAEWGGDKDGKKGKDPLVTGSTTSFTRRESLPGAVHVSNPLASSTNTSISTAQVEVAVMTMEDLQENASLCSSAATAEDDGLHLSAHLVLEDDSTTASGSGEIQGLGMLTSERQAPTEAPQPVVGVEAVVAVKDETRSQRRFLFGSLIGICLLMMIILVLALALAGAVGGEGEEEMISLNNPTLPPLSTLNRIREEGVLKCGHNAFFPTQGAHEKTLVSNHISLSSFESRMLRTGTDHRISSLTSQCQVVAAAIMGEAAQVKFVNMPLVAQRFFGLANGDVDLIALSVTHNMERDIHEPIAHAGLAFSTPYMYEGMKFAGDPFFVQCADNNLRHFEECLNLTVCVSKGGAGHKTLSALLPERNIVAMDFTTSQNFVEEQYSKGVCNLLAADASFLSALTIGESGYEGDVAVTETYFSKDPIAIATTSTDPEFSNFVNSVLEALLVAEQHNITQDKASSFPLTDLFGDLYQDAFQNAIAFSGHFGEIYDRFLEDQFPRASLNRINDGTTGLIYSHPFGLVRHGRDEKPLGLYMQRILDRGVLRCGVRTGFVGFARDQGDQLAGIDTDYCCAVAAALFQGDKRAIEYVQLDSVSDGFALLADGSVDILAGVTRNLENEVREPHTGLGFAFSQPYFYEHQEEKNHCLATRQEDKDWASFVYWVVSATFYAEEQGITMENSNTMPEVFVYGKTFHRMFRDSVLAAGSYSEIYERNLQRLIPRSGRNLLNASPNLGPQHYPLPGFFSS